MLSRLGIRFNRGRMFDMVWPAVWRWAITRWPKHPKTGGGQELTHCINFASRRLHKWCVLETPFPTLIKANLLSEYHFTKHAIRWSCLTSIWHSICHSFGFLCKPQFIEFYANTKKRGFFPSSCSRRHLDIWTCNWSGKTVLLVLMYGA